MTAATTPTASTFRDHVLRVLGEKTGLVAGIPVPMRDVLPLVYTASGYAEDQFGKDNHGYFKVRLWVQQAHNKILRKQGLTDNAGRGKWTLTDDGVNAAAVLLGQSVPAAPVPDAASTPAVEDMSIDDILDSLDADHDGTPSVAPVAPVAPVAASDADATPGTAPAPTNASEGGEGVAWTLGEQVNTYNPDPYIRGIAIEATNCFGQHSSRSRVCATCPLSGACKAAVVAEVSAIAAKFRQRAAEAAKGGTAPADAPDEGIDDILAIIEEDEPAPAPAPLADDARKMKLPADAKCRGCGDKATRGEEVVYVKGTGIFHQKCHGGTT